MDPGYTKWKGRLLEELISPVILLSKLRLRRGDIEPAQHDRDLMEATLMLRDAVKCRQFESRFHRAAVAGLIREFNDIANT